jgi:hypothetical protein
MARWFKKMSRSDAQQPTKGYPVPYLRLTKSDHPIDPKSWFQQVMFAGLTWRPGWHGKSAVEESEADFRVVDNGTDLGIIRLRLTHNKTRTKSHAHPATWIHWGSTLEARLRAHNREKWWVVVESGSPCLLTFQAKKP